MRRKLSLLLCVLLLPACAKRADLQVSQFQDGALTASDSVSADGPYQDRLTFDANAGQRLRIEMTSDSLDSFLRLLGPDGQVVTTNDDAMGQDAAITFRAGAAGRYTVVATSYPPRGKTTGPYRVSLADVPGTFADPGATATIAVEETKDGVLEMGDRSQEGGGAFLDQFDFRPAAAGSVAINLTSTQFDAYLILRDSSGADVATDDDTGGDRNARLTQTVEAGKLYRIMATTYGSAAKSGTYRLGVATATP